jgi:AcrR family transcriptional regulator
MPLTGPQAARRQRVIDAAIRLGAEGGYDAVQMRDVAARAEVAMGTVYRYFTSKDHLLAAALAYWAETLEDQVSRVPSRGKTPADRVADVLGRATRTMSRRPRLVAAMVTAVSSSDPSVVECQEQVSSTMERLIRTAIGEPAPPELDELTRVLGYVWYSTLIGWVNGWSNVGRVSDELEMASRLLLRGLG